MPPTGGWTQPKAKELQHRNTVCSLPQCNKTESVRPQATCNLALTSNQVYSKAKRQQIRSVFSTHVLSFRFFGPAPAVLPACSCLGPYSALRKCTLLHLSLAGKAQPAVAPQARLLANVLSSTTKCCALQSNANPCSTVSVWKRGSGYKKFTCAVRGGGVPVRVRRAHNPFWRVRNTRARTYSQTASVSRVASNKQKAIAVPRRGGIH